MESFGWQTGTVKEGGKEGEVPYSNTGSEGGKEQRETASKLRYHPHYSWTYTLYLPLEFRLHEIKNDTNVRMSRQASNQFPRPDQWLEKLKEVRARAQ
ncbi:hypothetical protein Pcinc_018492 [Petrolisthes cinctipes]|uniref:Uncharacterized protein n=1 Tax=Petrolisthes cinctipes TaxID=88211 RepID=A0AAE1KMQ3_PETCI|nr:hypothetical protein Pcinc_018492 [Petrolisthes cinctipes]